VCGTVEVSFRVLAGKGLRSCSHEGLRAPYLDQVAILIEDSPMPRDDASPFRGVGLQ
jgi:hypothetical protein